MQPVRKQVEDLVTGDLVDLETCPFLKHDPLAPYEYGRVDSVELEDNGNCVVVYYENFSATGYPAGTELNIAVEEAEAA